MPDELLVSEYPSNFIPSRALTFEACDTASASGDICVVVKGMYVDGMFHIQDESSNQNYLKE